ncbi:hypothetical protein AXF42_Ash013316 [Apostasia shenzhenica]|uniref:Uncharacterized protein n=1 Tax=Apostasia shenzhenica TaxID=1088818 RepID=A0A2I0BBL7_9ASPA|nr:hypothetical protein AXF42_Ash013316 [Apostasia shenzhenica]
MADKAAWAQDLFIPLPSGRKGQSCTVYCLQIPLNRLQGGHGGEQSPEHKQLLSNSHILTVLEPQLMSSLSLSSLFFSSLFSF